MKADAVIFDKDGTLLDFDAFWVAVSIKALEDVLARFEKQEVPLNELLAAFGVHDGRTDTDGILCKGTYAQMGQAVYDILRRYGCAASCEAVTEAVSQAYARHATAGEIQGTSPRLAEVLTALKNAGKKLALVTTDNESVTRYCLEQLGITAFFDKIYTDNGALPTKPDPYCALDFARLIGLHPKQMLMVGDTMTDIRFAKNAGMMSAALARDEKSRSALSPYADVMISSLTELLTIVE